MTYGFYDVFHAIEPIYNETQAEQFPAGYRLVATVCAQSLKGAYDVTSEYEWLEDGRRGGYLTPHVGASRPTSIGDVVADLSADEFYVVDFEGLSVAFRRMGGRKRGVLRLAVRMVSRLFR
jgi:hypothetical protein